MVDLEDVPKKIRIAAAFSLDEDFVQNRTTDALGVSEEYIRQIKRDLEEEERERVTEEEWERAQSYDVQHAVFEAMKEAGAFRGMPEFEEQGTVEVDVGEIEEEIERLSHLEESAKHGGDEERAFVAGSAREFLEGLLAGGDENED